MTREGFGERRYVVGDGGDRLALIAHAQSSAHVYMLQRDALILELINQPHQVIKGLCEGFDGKDLAADMAVQPDRPDPR